MLEIYIYNTTDPGFLDLLPNTILSFEALTEAFDEDGTNGEFSLPVEVPWTENNRRRLGFSERLENGKATDNFWVCTVYYKGFPQLVQARFTILGKVGKLNYRSGKFNASISGNKGLFGAALKNKKMTELQLGGRIAWEDMSSREFAYEHTTGGFPEFDQVRFVPVAFEGYFDDSRTDYSGEFLALDTVNTVIVTSPGVWTFGRPTSADPSIAAAEGVEEYHDYRTIPFYKLQYVLKQLFFENGYTVSGDLVDDDDFKNLLLFNNCSIEIYTDLFEDLNRSIHPANHVPDILQSEFIREIANALGLFVVFPGNNEVQFVFHNTSISGGTAVAIDDIITEDFESAYLDGNGSAKGYKVTMQPDSSDGYYSERIKDLSTKTIVATVAVRSTLDTLDIGRTFTINDIALVLAENMYYQVADATSDPVLWDAWSENLGPYQDGEGERAVDINVSTLAQYVSLNTGLGLYVNHNYVGTRQAGSYISFKRNEVKNAFGIRIFYGALRNIAGNVIPVSYNHNRDADNNIIEKYSLAVNVEDGLKKLHKPWQDIVQNAEVVKMGIRATDEALERLNRNKKFSIAGTVMFLKKVERTVPPGAVINTELVPL